jgi:hypothetical protein
VLGVGSKNSQRLYREVEAASVSDLADASPERDKLRASDIGGALDKRVGDVVDLVLVEAEAVATGGGFGALVRGLLDNVLEVVASELEELLEHCRGLLLVQRSHLVGLEEEACVFALLSCSSSRFTPKQMGLSFCFLLLSIPLDFHGKTRPNPGWIYDYPCGAGGSRIYFFFKIRVPAPPRTLYPLKHTKP